MNPNFYQPLCVCEECQDSHPKVISGKSRIGFSLHRGLSTSTVELGEALHRVGLP